MPLKTYYPEMKDPKPEADFFAQLSHRGGYIVQTPKTLRGVGIKYLDTLTADRLVPQAFHKVGWTEYRVTELAFKKLIKSELVAMECLL